MVSGTWDLAIHKTHAVDDDQFCFAASESEREPLLGCTVVIKYSNDCHCPALFVINVCIALVIFIVVRVLYCPGASRKSHLTRGKQLTRWDADHIVIFHFLLKLLH